LALYIFYCETPKTSWYSWFKRKGIENIWELFWKWW